MNGEARAVELDRALEAEDWIALGGEAYAVAAGCRRGDVPLSDRRLALVDGQWVARGVAVRPVLAVIL